MNSSKSESKLRPLVIDLDGTLIKSDTLFESANQYLLSRPDAFLKLAGWLIQGKSVLKNQLAQKVNLEPETLPFRQEVIEFIKKEKYKLINTLIIVMVMEERLTMRWLRSMI